MESIGTISWNYNKETHYGDITEIDFQDDDDILFRYITTNMVNMNPLIKYNFKTKRVYFLSERSSNGSYPYPEFESKGYPATIKFY